MRACPADGCGRHRGSDCQHAPYCSKCCQLTVPTSEPLQNPLHPLYPLRPPYRRRDARPPSGNVGAVPHSSLRVGLAVAHPVRREQVNLSDPHTPHHPLHSPQALARAVASFCSILPCHLSFISCPGLRNTLPRSASACGAGLWGMYVCRTLSRSAVTPPQRRLTHTPCQSPLTHLPGSTDSDL